MPRYYCSACGSRIESADAMVGRRDVCPVCKVVNVVPHLAVGGEQPLDELQAAVGHAGTQPSAKSLASPRHSRLSTVAIPVLMLGISLVAAIIGYRALEHVAGVSPQDEGAPNGVPADHTSGLHGTDSSFDENSAARLPLPSDGPKDLKPGEAVSGNPLPRGDKAKPSYPLAPSSAPTSTAPVYDLAGTSPLLNRAPTLQDGHLSGLDSDAMQKAREDTSKGNGQAAISTLTAIRSPQRDNPEYYYLLGCAYVQVGNDGIAVSAFKHAIVLQKDMLEAYLQLGLAYDRLGQERNALSSLIAGTGFVESDARFPYAIGVIHARRREWTDSKAWLSRASSLQGGAAQAAKEYLVQVERLEAKEREAAQQLEANKVKLRTALDEVARLLAAAKAEGRTALQVRERLKQQYDAERKAVDDAHREELVRINVVYASELQAIKGLIFTDLQDYTRKKLAIERRRSERVLAASSQRDNAYREIDQRYQPQVIAIDATVAQLEERVKALMQEEGELRSSLEKAGR